MSDMEPRAAYPDVYHAVAFTEMFIEGRILSDMRSMGLPPDKALLGIKRLADVPAKGPFLEAARTVARAEMDHPQFMVYLAIKLGAV